MKESELLKNPQILPDAGSNITTFHHISQNNDKILGPLTMNVAHLYIREIDEDVEQWDSYLKPFHEYLWIVLVLWMIISSVGIGITAWVALKFLNLEGFTLLDQVLTPLSAFCNQGIIKAVP